MAISCDTFLGTKPNSCNVGYAPLQTVKGCIASAELFALGCILYRWSMHSWEVARNTRSQNNNHADNSTAYALIRATLAPM